MQKQNYFFTTISLYFNYVLQGMAAIILVQNMSPLTQQLHTSVAGMSIVISAIGFGRIFILYPAGYLSDCFGRKLIVLLGMSCYVVFLLVY